MVPLEQTEVSRGERSWTTSKATLDTVLAIIDGAPRRMVVYGG
jgi:hypothetical protein